MMQFMPEPAPVHFVDLTVTLGNRVIYRKRVLYGGSPVDNRKTFEGALEFICALVRSKEISTVDVSNLRAQYIKICEQWGSYTAQLTREQRVELQDAGHETDVEAIRLMIRTRMNTFAAAVSTREAALQALRLSALAKARSRS